MSYSLYDFTYFMSGMGGIRISEYYSEIRRYYVLILVKHILNPTFIVVFPYFSFPS